MIESALLPAAGIAILTSAGVAARAAGLIGGRGRECWRRSGCVLKESDPAACGSCPVFVTAHRYRKSLAVGVVERARVAPELRPIGVEA